MISNIRKEVQKRKEDNKGATIVMVIVAIAFIGMLVAMVLYMSYCNYLMKNSDKRAKDNFYTAEYALEVINAGLQHDISEAMSAAYVDTMKNSSNRLSEELTNDFNTYYFNEIGKKLLDGTNKWKADHLRAMWTGAGITVASAPGVQGAYLADPGANTYTVTANSHITLSGVNIVYTDDRGYVSIIKTDIRVKVPSIDFAQSASSMKIENFSLIANDSLVNANIAAPNPTYAATVGSNVEISGSVFGGYEGIRVEDHKSTKFVVDPNDATEAGEDEYDLIAKSINLRNLKNSNSVFSVDETFSTYVTDINLQTAVLDLDGKTYVGDDMDIAGRGSSVTLGGSYSGYGNMHGDSEGSSSILINGANTDLDFRGLDELVLSGHAYVGAKKYDADVDRLAYAQGTTVGNVTDDEITEDTDPDKLKDYVANANTMPQNTADILMGESISVKPNQMLYLVPPECIGYEAGTNNQVITKNPMTYAEYKMLTDTTTGEYELDEDGNRIPIPGTNPLQFREKKRYEPVRLSALWSKLGGNAYTSDYQAVYRRVDGTVLVYLYLDFGGNEVMANEFFKAYYNYDKTGIQSYVNSYINTLQWNPELDRDASKLTLAGNAFKLDAGKNVVFVENSTSEAQKQINMSEMQDLYSNVYESLMHTLSKDYEQMTTEQQGAEIFDTIVDDAKLTELDDKPFKNADDSLRVTIKDGDVLYPSGDCVEGKTKVIIASGDVYVTKDFEGLIIAGGNIYVCSGCNKIYYNPRLVRQALNATYTDVTGKVHYAYDVLGESGRLSYGFMTDNGAGESIDLQDLITYQNWKKE